MAQPTTEHGHPAAAQAHTPGMVTQHADKKAKDAPTTKALDPVLVEGIDPVLLHRLYPDADSIADVSARALAQGKETMERGATLEADQQASAHPAPADKPASAGKPASTP